MGSTQLAERSPPAAPAAEPDGRLAAALFALGSVCFAAASVASQWASAPRPWIGVTFFTGSVFFTAGGLAALRDTWRAAGTRRDRVAAAVQLAGTLFFNLSTFHALQSGLTAGETDLRVWTPDVVGSICFLVSSTLAYEAVCGSALPLHPPVTTAGRVAALNLAGSVAFGASAVAALVEPSSGEPVNAAIANATTTLGALCFLAGALPALLPLRRRLIPSG